ncbi:MAG: LecA/PA-IL family lectin [Pyrinomonadaceae bacterium]
MYKSKSAIAAIRAMIVVLVLASAAAADTIRLKDGSIIKGTIVSFRDGKFIVAIGEGSRRRELSFDAAEVASIEFDAATPSNGSAPPRQAAAAQSPAYKVVTTENIASTTRPAAPASSASGPPAPAASAARPIEIDIKVLADNTANGWTNSGWVVKRGQRVRVSARGTVSLGAGRTATPSGLADLDDPQKLMPNVATGALIAVIGDDNNDFIYIGSMREFTADRDGALFFGVNEGDLTDNSGAFDVKIEILPL